jgi:hypothetical protein
MPEVAEEIYPTDTTILVRDSKIGWASALKELITMLIEANNHLYSRPLTWRNEGFFPNQTYTTFGDLCSCNPKNGGSGICGCVMANQEIKR